LLEAFTLTLEIAAQRGIIQAGDDSALLDLLEGWDFGHVDDVVQFNVAWANKYLAVVVYTEITHRMG